MADLAGIALSGLRANQAALATTSHNITNLDTAGYSRQETHLETRTPSRFAGGFAGQGVNIQGIERVSNQYVVEQVRIDTSNANSADGYFEYASRVDKLLGGDATAVGPALQNFFDSIQNLTNDPSSLSNREVVLRNAQSLAQRFNSLDDHLSQLNATLNTELEIVTSKVTELTQTIAGYNEAIRSTISNNTGEQPNDLLDQRDEAVRQLAELVGIDVLPQPNNTVNIFTGSGQPLLVGTEAYELSVDSSVNNSNRDEVLLSGKEGTEQNVTSLISGGRLGGLLSVREQILDPVFNELGRIGLVLSDTLNTQHALGMDLDGELGGLFFNDINTAGSELSRVAAASDNTGSLAISVTIDDTSLLDPTQYNLRYDAGNFVLYNADGSVNTTIADPGVGGTIPVAEGFTINRLAGTPNDGDEFAVYPTRTGAALIGVAVTDPRDIAAALPVTTEIPLNNRGTVKINEVSVYDTTAASFATPNTLTPRYRIEFTSDTEYSIIDADTNASVATNVAFVPGQLNDLIAQASLATDPGYEVQVSGQPVAGDVIDIQYNSNGIADNRNALKLTALAGEKTVGQGDKSYQTAYSTMVSQVATRTSEASISQEAASTILNQSESLWESISGVNLDEEAANLMRFQQAYQASARVMQVTGELFDTIIGSL